MIKNNVETRFRWYYFGDTLFKLYLTSECDVWDLINVFFDAIGMKREDNE